MCEEDFEVNNWKIDSSDDEFITVKDEQKKYLRKFGESIASK